MQLSAEEKKRLQTKPAEFIEQQIKEFVRTSPDGRLSFMNGYVLWDEPLVRFADGEDPLFADYKRIIGADHLTPREALATAYGKRPQDIPERLSVISWVLPITEETRKSNRIETRVPSRLWCHTRWLGEAFNDKLRAYVVELLSDAGHLATAPMGQPYFKQLSNEKGLYSNWSERHAAYVAGHGTFSLSDGLITERGIAHRCGNVITNLALPASPRTAKSPYSNCLFFAGVDCRACIERCPGGAITEKGHDKIKCRDYMRSIGYRVENLRQGYDKDKSVAGCGFCQTKVPCEFENPLKKLKKKG